MKNRKKRFCPKCSNQLKLEDDKYLKKDYKYQCTSCYENFYSFEAIKTTKKRKKQ